MDDRGALSNRPHVRDVRQSAPRVARAVGPPSDADKEAYQTQIDEFVVPIEERSLDAYENGWKKAVDLNIYNQWTAKMREALGRLNAELYPPFKEIGFEVRSQAPHPADLIDSPRRGANAAAPSAAAKPLRRNR